MRDSFLLICHTSRASADESRTMRIDAFSYHELESLEFGSGFAR
jgi:hypothetical protein